MSARPRGWALLDHLERWRSRVWPARLHGAVGIVFIAPAVLLVGILLIGLGYMLEYSLHELDLSTYRLGEDYTLSNYRTLADQSVYLKVLLRTLLSASLVTVSTLFLAFPYAYVMVRTDSSALRKCLLVALFLPFFIGQVVRAYGWLIILGKQGLLNSILLAWGLPAMDLIYNTGAVIFGLVQYMLPFAVLLIVPAITSIGEDYELAAESLGANWIRTFRHVVLPMARPGIVVAGIVVFTLTLTDFAMPEILGGGTSDFIASAIYDSFFQLSNTGLGAALSIVLVTLGSVLVAGVFAVTGAGTLSLRGDPQ